MLLCASLSLEVREIQIQIESDRAYSLLYLFFVAEVIYQISILAGLI